MAARRARPLLPILPLLSLLLAAACGGGDGTIPSAPAPPVVAAFEAADSTVPLGSGTTLSWRVTGADNVVVLPGVGPVPGDNAFVTPAAPTTYTLVATGAGGQARAQVDVGVTCTVTFAAGHGGSLSGPASQVVPWGGSTAAVTALPDAAHAFSAWRGAGFAGSGLVSLSVDNVTSNLDLVADFGYPDLDGWLGAHPAVAAAVQWQTRPGDAANYYAPPAAGDKAAWADWTARQKDDLRQAYLGACAWLDCGAVQPAMPVGGLTDAPANQHPQANVDSVSTLERVTAAYAWNLYVAHVGFSLALETTHRLPWSIAGDSPAALRYLFDSATMAWRLPDGNFGMGTYGGANLPALRANNLPKTAFAPPEWSYPFVSGGGMVQGSRLATIGRLLDWMRANLAHFYGPDNFGNYDAVWQYRGYPPLSRIVGGTVDANNPGLGAQHWTAGCHGSVGFLAAVLRAVNIPVQPVWVCGHELAWFPTEDLYLDHGDDPYNLNVKNGAGASLSLLVDAATYAGWFTADASANILDFASPACANVGRRAAEFR